MSLIDWFLQGGIYMWLVLLVDVLVVIVTAVLLSVYKPKKFKLLLVTIIIFSFLPVLLGAYGGWVGYQEAMTALSFANPADKDDLYKATMKVIWIPCEFGAISSILLLIGGVVGIKLR